MKDLTLLVRDTWGGFLHMIPLPWFDRLRHAFQQSPPGTAAWHRQQRLLNRLRYRPLDDGPSIFSIQYGSPLQLINDGSLISCCLYWLGYEGYEPDVARCWARCCSQARGILEIGCNIGYMTLRGASSAPLDVSYTAAEPNPEALRSLHQNLSLNQMNRVRVLEAAVVGRTDQPTMKFCVSTLDTYTAPAGSHLAKVSAPTAHERTVDVPVKEIGELLAGVDTLKLDAEGAELDILAVAAETLSFHRAVILVEVLDEAAELRAFLAEFARTEQYRLLIIGPRLIEIAPNNLPNLKLWGAHRSRDLLVIPRERMPDLEVTSLSEKRFS